MRELSQRDEDEYRTKNNVKGFHGDLEEQWPNKVMSNSKKVIKTASVKTISKSVEKQFADDYNSQKAKIDRLTKAIKLTQSEPKVAELKTLDGKTRSVFTTTSRDGKPLYVASTDGQNVRQFTNVDDVKEFLGQ